MAALPSAGGPYPPFPPRRRPLRWLFLALGLVVLGFGVFLLFLSLDPAAFGLTQRFGFPFGGGLLGIFLLLWGVLMVARSASRFGRAGPYGGPRRRFDPAIFAARQRYARGEITREQFQQIVQDLRGPPRPPP